MLVFLTKTTAVLSTEFHREIGEHHMMSCHRSAADLMHLKYGFLKAYDESAVDRA